MNSIKPSDLEDVRRLVRNEPEPVDWEANYLAGWQHRATKAEARAEAAEQEVRQLREWLNLNEHGDGIWCPRCGKVFHDSDVDANPDDYFECPLCGGMQHRACRGPIDDEQLSTEEQLASVAQQLAEAQALLRAAGAAGFAMREQLVEAQGRVAELERLMPDADVLEHVANHVLMNDSFASLMEYVTAIRKYREGK